MLGLKQILTSLRAGKERRTGEKLAGMHSMSTAKTLTEEGYTELRDAMVETQIRKRGIADERVLRAMRSVPRHEFVESHWKNVAYTDEPLPIGGGQTISQPYIVAVMCAAVHLESMEKVLEIGTGCGYQAAVLSCLGPGGTHGRIPGGGLQVGRVSGCNGWGTETSMFTAATDRWACGVRAL